MNGAREEVRRLLSSRCRCSSVEVKLSVALLDYLLVCLFEVLGHDDISVFANSLHTSLLSDRLDISSRNLLRTTHEVFQVDFLTQVHLTCQCLEHEALLPSVGQWELDFAIKTTRAEQGGIQSVCPVCRHDNFHIYGLIETIHLSEELDQDTLHFTISTSVGIITFGGDGVDLINKDN